ncbi:MAG: radical SAM protein [Candidatus Sericytochromatia bacterium]
MSQAEAPQYFFQRFDPATGNVLGKWPRITTDESVKNFPPRENGLKILLINPPIREWSFPNIIPIGQSYVASVAVMDGHTVEVLDLNAERKAPVKDKSKEEFSRWIETLVQTAISQSQPDVIGIGGIITQYSRIKEIATLCKSLRPEAHLILGGGIATSTPMFMVKRLPIDSAVLEEGEVTFSHFLYQLEHKLPLSEVPGLAWKEQTSEGEKIHNNGLRPSIAAQDAGLDHLPWPLRQLWPVDDIYKVNPVGHLNWKSKWIDGQATEESPFSVSMIGSRGCPYAVKACDYCYASYLGAKYRLRSPHEVVNEMEYLQQRYGVSYIHFLDDLLMTDYRWAIAFCEELLKRKAETGFEIIWGGTCRTNIVADDIARGRKQGRKHMLEYAFEAGMRQVGFGIESASPTILKSIDKSGQTLEKMEIAVKEVQRIFGYADCSFIIGSPGESKTTVEETVEFCKKVDLHPEVFFFTTAYPGTTFWQLALDKGLIRKAVTGEKGPADEDIIEEYFKRLGEQGEEVRTNFSDLEDQEVIDLSWWAIQELGAQNTVRHPHTGEEQASVKPALIGASRADL